MELIREMLGHSDIRTTESYLKRFDFDKKRAANESTHEILGNGISKDFYPEDYEH